ncbi:MAG: hypothetical protein AABW79_00605 [Nanoarchaeota archaeon]
MNSKDKKDYLFSILRILIGLIFLWAFFDKLIGLGFATCLNTETQKLEIMCDKAWLNGGSPTFGYLSYATKGPLAGFYQSLASLPIVDWLFMFGLLGVGLTLTFGFLIRFGSLVGALMLFLMWTAVFPPEHHPFVDDHIINIIILLGLAFINTGKNWSLGNWWLNLSFLFKKII